MFFKFPAGIGALVSLRRLQLSNNSIRVLPADALTPLRNLRELSLSHNELTELPSLASLSSTLQYLWLQGNKVGRKIMECVCAYVRELSLFHNKLTELP